MQLPAKLSRAASEAASSEEAKELSTTDALRIAGLKGPTTMGLVNLLSMEEDGTASMDYDLQLYGAADEIVPLLMKGELDMAAIPANLAATLYQKTNGGIQAVAVNTLGVLYVVEKGDTVQSMADLKGRTILSTGKGTTPEYVLRYLLNANGIDPDKDVTIEYYSEATEVTAQMANTEDAIAVLPQPYVTAAGLQDDTLRVALDLTEEWNKVADTQLITGVTVVRKEYAEEHPDVVAAFLTDYAKSVKAANTDLDGTAALCEEQGVVAKAAIAKKALPNCNIVCLTGDELKQTHPLTCRCCLMPTPPPWAAQCPATISTGRPSNSNKPSLRSRCALVRTAALFCLLDPSFCAQKSERNFVREIDRK